MSARGLPGFLRRSIRRNSVEDDDEDNDHDTTNNIDNDDDDVKVVVQNKFDQQKQDNNEQDEEVDQEKDNVIDINHNNHRKHSISSKSNDVTDTTNTTSGSSSSTNNNNNNNSNNNNNIDLITTALSDSWQEVTTTTSINNNPTNTTNNTNNNIKTTKSYREQQYEKLLFNNNVENINMIELRKLTWNGIPVIYRSFVWKLLLSYIPTNIHRRTTTIQRKRNEYNDIIQLHYNIDDTTRTIQEQETLRQILVDVPRTQPNIILFRNDRIKRTITRLLYIWSIRHPASSYVQGINDLITPLFVVFLADYFFQKNNHTNNEDYSTTFTTTTTNNNNNNTSSSSQQIQIQQREQQHNHDQIYNMVLDGQCMDQINDEILYNVETDVYWCITNLLSNIQDHYTNDQPGIQRMVLRLEELVYRIDQELTIYIRDTIGIQFLQFSFKWMNCLLLREFTLKCIIRLWDTYLTEKNGFDDFHVYVCAALMCQFSTQLQQMNFDELFHFMQSIPTTDWTDTEIEVLLSQAYVLSTLFKGSDAHLTNNNNNNNHHHT